MNGDQDVAGLCGREVILKVALEGAPRAVDGVTAQPCSDISFVGR